MLRELTREELLDALAFYAIDPPGDRRADLRAMVATIATTGSDDPPKAMYPYYGDSIEQMIEDEEQIAYMKSIDDDIDQDIDQDIDDETDDEFEGLEDDTAT